MIKEITTTGKDLEDAKETARMLLGVMDSADDVKFEILDAGSKGIFGIVGVRPPKVRAWIEVPGDEPKESRPRRENNRRRNDAPKAAPAETEVKVDAPAAEKSEKKEGGNRRKRRRKPARERVVIPPMPETAAAPRAAMIPESELKMEPVEVKEGENLSFDFVTNLIRDIGLSAEASLYACEDNTNRIVIAGEDASLFIGHHGDTLDALQYLANLAAARNKKEDGEKAKRVTIDIEGYRKKREETLRALARRMAEKALRNQRSVMLEPMTPYERRIIHYEVQGIEGVSTNSIGSDLNRKVVIYLVKKKDNETANETATTDENADA